MQVLDFNSSDFSPCPDRGEFVHDISSYTLVNSETAVHLDGTLVAKFCKNCDISIHPLSDAVTANQRRGWAAGIVKSEPGDLLYKYDKTYVPLPKGSNVKAKRNKNGTLSPYNEGNKVHSGHFGYCEAGKNHRANVRAGKTTFSSEAPGARYRPYAWVRKNPRKWEACVPYFQSIDAVMKATMPAQWRWQQTAAKTCPVTMGGSVWTTGAVNRNFQTACHLDGDYAGSFSSLTTHGNFEGGELLLPQIKLAFDVRPSDVLFCRTNMLWHCNAPILSGVRTSTVCYLRGRLVGKQISL